MSLATATDENTGYTKRVYAIVSSTLIAQDLIIPQYIYAPETGLLEIGVIANSCFEETDSDADDPKKLNGTLTLSESIISIGNSAFKFCSGLQGTLTLPSFNNSYTKIEIDDLPSMDIEPNLNFGSFQNCTGDTFTVHFQPGLVEIPDACFEGVFTDTVRTVTINIP
jgi:hypothetical protein